MVADAHHAAGTHTVVLHHIAAAQQLLQLSRIAFLLLHVDARAVGDAIADASHTDGSTRMLRQRLQPGAEVGQQLVVILERCAIAEAMTSGRIYMKGAMIAGSAHGGVIGHAIGHRRHGAIVVGSKDDGRRGEMTANGILVGPFPHQCLVLHSFAAQESLAGTTMTLTLVHRDDGIEEDAEVGAAVKLAVRGDARCQMPASRRAHDAHIEGIDAPDESRVTHGADGILGIREGDAAVALRHAVGKHEVGNALLVEIGSPVVTLMVHSQMGVASAGQCHHGPPRGLVGQVSHHVGSPVRGDVHSKLACRLSPEGQCQCCQQHRCQFPSHDRFVVS